MTISNINPAYEWAPRSGQAPASTKGSATISMPATFALGASYTMGKLTVNADADWTFWHSYTSLPITIQDHGADALQDQTTRRNGKTSSPSGSGRSIG